MSALSVAMLYAASAIEWSREYSYWANHARNARKAGKTRKCAVCAAYAGDAKRRALRYAAMHRAALADIRA